MTRNSSATWASTDNAVPTTCSRTSRHPIRPCAISRSNSSFPRSPSLSMTASWCFPAVIRANSLSILIDLLDLSIVFCLLKISCLLEMCWEGAKNPFKKRVRPLAIGARGVKFDLINQAASMEGGKMSGQTRRALVVEDEPIALRSMAGFLENVGFSVTRAEDGAAGAQLFREGGLDLVLTDLMMPKLGGAGADQDHRRRGSRPTDHRGVRDRQPQGRGRLVEARGLGLPSQADHGHGGAAPGDRPGLRARRVPQGAPRLP